MIPSLHNIPQTQINKNSAIKQVIFAGIHRGLSPGDCCASLQGEIGIFQAWRAHVVFQWQVAASMCS